MAQTESIEQSFVTINETLDRMEARIDNMNKMLSEIVAEIEKHWLDTKIFIPKDK